MMYVHIYIYIYIINIYTHRHMCMFMQHTHAHIWMHVCMAVHMLVRVVLQRETGFSTSLVYPLKDHKGSMKGQLVLARAANPGVATAARAV